MDTRQLAAFCEVVERRSFSDAAARLGVTQPAVSQQVRALEQRLGTQLLDRSGRRVEPTEAGLRLYRGAQRMLAFEEQLLEELGEPEGPLRGTLEIGASTGPAAIVLPLLLCEFQRDNPDVRVELSVSDTQSVVELVADRRLELGIVGAARRHRSVAFEPFFRDEVILVCPPGHPFAGKTIALDELSKGPLILMQQGAGVRQMVEDELRKGGRKLRDLEAPLELGLQESVRSAVQAWIRGLVHLAPRGGGGARGGHARRGACPRARPGTRDLDRSRRGPRGQLGRAGVRHLRARAARPVIVRWGLEELPGVLDDAGIDRPLLVASERWDRLEIPAPHRWTEIPSDRITVPPGVDGILAVGGGSAIDTAKAASAASDLPLVSVPTTYSGAEWTGFFGVRTRERRQVGGGSGARPAGIVYDPELTLDLPRGASGGTALNALAHCVEALYPGELEVARRGAAAIDEWLPRVLENGTDLEARKHLLEGACDAGQALAERGLYLGHAMAQAVGGRYGIPHGASNALCLPPAMRFNATGRRRGR